MAFLCVDPQFWKRTGAASTERSTSSRGVCLASSLEDIQSGDPTEPGYDAAVRVLQELFVEGVDAERTTLFPRLRESSLDLVELGGRLAARAGELLSADEDDEPS